MDTKHEIPYLSDDELMSMIDEIEHTQGEYVQAPDMLEEQVFLRIAPRETISLEERRQRKKRELQRYTLRVALSAAASIAILLALPLVQQNGVVTQDQTQEQQAQENAQRQKQQFEKTIQERQSVDEQRRQAYESRGEEKESMLDGLGNFLSEILK